MIDEDESLRWLLYFCSGAWNFFCHVCNYIRSLLILPISTGEQTRSTKKHEIPPWVHVFPAHSTLVCSFKDLKDLWFSLWLHQVLNKCCVSLCFCFWFVLLQPTSGSRQLSVGMWWRVQATWQKVAKLVSIPSCSRQGWTPLWLYGFVWTFIGKPLNPSKSIAYSSLSWPIGSMYAIYMVTFTINIPPMLAYIPYMDPMGEENCHLGVSSIFRLSRPYTRSGCEHPLISYFGVQKRGTRPVFRAIAK